jgi:hypothetical protein
LIVQWLEVNRLILNLKNLTLKYPGDAKLKIELQEQEKVEKQLKNRIDILRSEEIREEVQQVRDDIGIFEV